MNTPKRVSAVKDLTVPAAHSRTVGIDTDRDMLVVGFLDTQQATLSVREFAQRHDSVKELVDSLLTFQPSLIVIESTGQYHLMAHDAIRAAGLNICVINPQVIAALIRVEGKSDARDAGTLARLAASFPLRASNMPDELQRELRLMFKRQDEARDWERRCYQRLWGHLAACGSPWPRLVTTGSNHARRMAAAQVRGESVEEIMSHYRGRRGDEVRQAITPLSGQRQVYAASLLTQALTHQACVEQAEFDLAIAGQREEVAEVVRILTSVPAVSFSLAMRFIAELGLRAPQRYPKPDSFCKAIGIAPNQEITGGKVVKATRSRGRTKLRYYLRMSVSGYLLSHKAHFLNWRYQNYRRKANHRMAVAAQAHKVAEWVYGCWKRRQPFNEYRALRYNEWRQEPDKWTAAAAEERELDARQTSP